jgi:Ni,Fe-hydrogenase III large subunit
MIQDRSASAIIRAGEPIDCHPRTRHLLTQQNWFDMAHALPAEPGLAFTALWADATHIHALFHADGPLLASVPVEAGLYTALSPARPGATFFERAVSDLWGHQAADAADTRPWLDHGVWPTLRPLSDRPVPNAAAPTDAEPDIPDMTDHPGEALSSGPLPPGPAAPSYWRATITGNHVQNLEARFGWAHRGVLGLMRGKSPAGAARFAARIDGAATVAHSTAFARAVEAAVRFTPPPAALGLRALMLALERAAIGLHDIHATATALGLALPAAITARAALLDACATVFGHRLMMDCVKPGGVASEPTAESLAALDDTLATIAPLHRAWPDIGALPLRDALRLSTPGAAGRAAGRLDPAMPEATLLTTGDLAARMALLATAIDDDVEAARTHLANLPAGATTAILPHAAAEGLAMANGPHGPVWHWVRLANGTVAANFAAGPAWLHLPSAECAAHGLPVEAIPALIASFGLRPAGMDL